jgi:hypothetical protein
MTNERADAPYSEESAFLDLMNRLLAKHILVVNGESIHGYSTEQMGMAFKAGLNARRSDTAAPQPDPFREAVHKLVDKMEACHADPKYKSVWTINQIHTGPYTGPNYATELAAVKSHMRSVGVATDDRAEGGNRG